jgi:hypothetical protein
MWAMPAMDRRSEMTTCEQEFEFTLVLSGIDDLTQEVEDALFEAGCDDALLSIRSGVPYLSFARRAPSMREAILSAIRDVLSTDVGLEVMRVDDCNLVTLAEIGRKIGRTRQLVHQFATGTRGAGGFPPPACHITDKHPLWRWCEVAYWLRANNMLKEETYIEAIDIDVINASLDWYHKHKTSPQLTADVLAIVEG